LAADVAGYSRLMHHDQEATHAKLTALLADSVAPAISEHGGRIVKNTGDGFLAEFPSAVEAVRAAVQFQTRIEELTTADEDDKRIAFRVGINVGDVIVESASATVTSAMKIRISTGDISHVLPSETRQKLAGLWIVQQRARPLTPDACPSLAAPGVRCLPSRCLSW
jgi:hypothetical protein